MDALIAEKRGTYYQMIDHMEQDQPLSAKPGQAPGSPGDRGGPAFDEDSPYQPPRPMSRNYNREEEETDSPDRKQLRMSGQCQRPEFGDMLAPAMWAQGETCHEVPYLPVCPPPAPAFIPVPITTKYPFDSFCPMDILGWKQGKASVAPALPPTPFPVYVTLGFGSYAFDCRYVANRSPGKGSVLFAGGWEGLAHQGPRTKSGWSGEGNLANYKPYVKIS